ncbi:sulfite exporter TauE/SafE family protein [Paraglaciecola sp.]|uniref:sulfite exporter TauE/SafE family protein n=1 Tax=Paraglaciecola sp. TaxID=1920173 RepID=UPI00273D88BC|nr:sulfite exporter TauE/SafE family protein [Paraglaciecola sp.]MDP5032861.1 sulfite exporter TauE/SafE family protein [Paraglaciecola sp.]
MNFLVVLGAAIIGLSLGLLGSGGSIITMPLLLYVVGETEKLAIAESLLIVGSIALVGSLIQAKSKLINLRYILWFGLPSMIGTYLGAWAAQFVKGEIQVLTFSVVMLLSSRMMLKSPIANAQPKPSSSILSVILAGVTVGTLAGFVGVGGGFLIVPALFLLARLSLQQATATSLVIIALQSFTGFAKYAYLLNQAQIAINWPVVTSMIVIGSIGVIVGSKLSRRLPQQTIKRMFAAMLICLGIFMFFHTVYALYLS